MKKVLVSTAINSNHWYEEVIELRKMRAERMIKEMNCLKDTLLSPYYSLKSVGDTPSKMVVAVQRPCGATEIIINTEEIETKVKYYDMAYNENFELISNPNVKVVGVMFV